MAIINAVLPNRLALSTSIFSSTRSLVRVSTSSIVAAERRALAAMLLERGAHLHDRTRAGWDALMIAANYGLTQMVEQLLFKGADSKAADRKGRSALHLAALKGHTDVVSILAKMKASDSRECRSCHSWDGMDLSEQDKSARKRHGRADPCHPRNGSTYGI